MVGKQVANRVGHLACLEASNPPLGSNPLVCELLKLLGGYLG